MKKGSGDWIDAAFIAFVLIFHIWTTVIAYERGGADRAIVTFILPGLSEIVWLIKLWGHNTLYCVLCFPYLILGYAVYKTTGK